MFYPNQWRWKSSHSHETHPTIYIYILPNKSQYQRLNPNKSPCSVLLFLWVSCSSHHQKSRFQSMFPLTHPLQSHNIYIYIVYYDITIRIYIYIYTTMKTYPTHQSSATRVLKVAPATASPSPEGGWYPAPQDVGSLEDHRKTMGKP